MTGNHSEPQIVCTYDLVAKPGNLGSFLVLLLQTRSLLGRKTTSRCPPATTAKTINRRHDGRLSEDEKLMFYVNHKAL